MNEHDWLAQQFEEKRAHLRAVAYRMLGSLSEAEDAVQEAWLKLSRSDVDEIENLGGWLTTVVARVCLDMLRSRKSRNEESIETQTTEPAIHRSAKVNPETEVMLADSVGLALLVVLDTLSPAERLAFVLHDMFDLSFDEIAAISGRTPVAARQLASRARRRVQGKEVAHDADISRQREVVDAFLAAARKGDFNGLLAVLDPEVVVHTDDAGAVLTNTQTGTWSAESLAEKVARGGARFARVALVNGSVGVVVAPLGRLRMVFRYTIVGSKIAGVEVVADPQRLAELELSVLGND
ncbi:MAG TPA: sigma-70 family RNA polymerase sigma factor [Edaphobacter sp.]|nr:sigma-70 family RNA polymerase sigma factor [Edaphobacter sp.]